MRGALFALAAGLSAAVQLRDIQGGSLEPLDVPNDQCGVVVSAQEDDRLTLFAVGQDGQLWHKYKLPNANMGELASGSTDGFTIWSSMGGSFLGGPSVVRDSRAKLMVFARGADRAIYMLEQQAPNSETWGHFTSLGGSMSSAPRAVLNSEGFVHVFAKSFGDNSLMHKFQFASENGTCWSEWGSLGGSLTSLPSVLLDAEALLHVFARGPDRALWHKRQLGSHTARTVLWGEWECLSGVLASGPSIPSTLSGVNLVETIVRASDKGYWHKGQAGSHAAGVWWKEWVPLGGIFASGPAAVLNANNMLEVFGRGPDRGIWHKRQYMSITGNTSWTRWTPLGGLTSTGPTVRMTRDGMIHLFVRGVDKSIWYKSQALVNETLQFGAWKLLGGNTRAFSC